MESNLNTRSSALLRPKAFVQKHEQFSLGQVRWLIHNAERNGLANSGALIRVNPSGKPGRPTIWLDEPKFFDWLRNQARSAA